MTPWCGVLWSGVEWSGFGLEVECFAVEMLNNSAADVERMTESMIAVAVTVAVTVAVWLRMKVGMRR